MKILVRKYLKDNWKAVLTYALFFCIAVLTLLFIYKDNVSVQRSQPRIEITVPRPDQGTATTNFSIETGTEIEQDISIPGTTFSGFSLNLNNGNGLTEGELKVSLYEKNSGALVQDWDVDMKQCSYNGYCTFNLAEDQSVESGDVYTVIIDTTGIEGQDIVFTAYQCEDQDSGMFINDVQDKEYALCYQVVGDSCSALKEMYIVFMLIILGGIIIGFFTFCRKFKPEYNFLILAMIIGVVYILVIPPWSTQDGEAHFATAYAQSSYLLGKDVTDESGRVIVEDGVDNLIFYNPRPGKTAYVNYWDGLVGNEPLVNANTGTLRRPLTMGHLGYAPQVIGISLGRLLALSAEQIFLCGRVFALLWYCGIMFWAIKIIPIGKIGLCVIGLLPMTMQQAVSYNYDSVLNGTIFFGIAYLLWLVYEKEKICIKDVIIIAAVTVIIAQIKFIYLPICFLGFAISSQKFGGLKKKITAISFVGVVSVFFMLIKELERITNIVNPGISSGTAVAEQVYTISYCMEHLFATCCIVFRTLRENFSFYVETMIGSRLGWHHEIFIPTVIIMGFVVLLYVGTLRKEEENYLTSWKEKIISVLVVLSISGLVMLSLLLSEKTAITARTIWGIQGRYFLPVLPFILLLCRTQKINIRKEGDQWVFCAIHVLQICTVINIILSIVIS